MKNDLSVVINYCTNDQKFIQHTINQSQKFTSKIFVVYSDHFFDGTIENIKSIEKLIQKNPKIVFIKLKFLNNKTKFFWDDIYLLSRLVGKFWLYGAQYWICKQRHIGFQYSKKKSQYTLFLDADEVPDGKKIKNWLKTKAYQNYNVIKLANYYYFRKNIYQATNYYDSPTLVKNKIVKDKYLFSRHERQNLFNKIANPKKRLVMGVDGKPMIHHYSWARTKKEMVKKTQTWGHNHYRNWNILIEKEFSHRFNGRAFTDACPFKKVKPFIDLD